jgi:energy-converting hydrogenase Eha subunit E
VLGLALNITAFIIVGLQMVVTEKIFLLYAISPNQFSGYCGAMGSALLTSLIALFSFTSCPLDASQCVADSQGNYHLESFPGFFDDLSGDWYLILLVALNVVAIGRFYYDRNTLVFVGNAVLSQLVNIFANGIIWIAGVLVTVIGEGNSDFNIESLQLEVILVKIAGFGVTIISLLLYNETVKLCWGQAQKRDELLP